MKEKGRRLLEVGRDKVRNERVWGLIWLKHIIYLKESILSKLIAIHNIPIKKNLDIRKHNDYNRHIIWSMPKTLFFKVYKALYTL